MQGVPGSSPGASTNESLNQSKVFSEIASLSAFVPFVDRGGDFVGPCIKNGDFEALDSYLLRCEPNMA
jgi:hypothetical protein